MQDKCVVANCNNTVDTLGICALKRRNDAKNMGGLCEEKLAQTKGTCELHLAVCLQHFKSDPSCSKSG